MTVTATLDRTAFVSRVSAFIGRSRNIAYNKEAATSSRRFNSVMEDVARYARYNEEDGIPAVFGNTIYGIQWAVETGRVNGQTHVALKAMRVRELVNLIYEVHTSCANIGEFAAYLMQYVK